MNKLQKSISKMNYFKNDSYRKKIWDNKMKWIKIEENIEKEGIQVKLKRSYFQYNLLIIDEELENLILKNESIKREKSKRRKIVYEGQEWIVEKRKV